MKTENKLQSLLSRGIGSWPRSITTTIMETQFSFLHMVTNICDIQHATLTVDVAPTTHSMHSKKLTNKKVNI